MSNEMKLEFDAVSENEGFARVAVAAFVTPLDPTLQEVADVENRCFRGCYQCHHTWLCRRGLRWQGRARW